VRSSPGSEGEACWDPRGKRMKKRKKKEEKEKGAVFGRRKREVFPTRQRVVGNPKSIGNSSPNTTL
jgi:hypothetical protein